MRITIPKPYERSIAKVRRFKGLLEEYLRLDSEQRLSDQQEVRLSQLRQELNLSLDEAATLVRHSGVTTEMYYEPAPIVGGLAHPIDLFANLFVLQNFHIPRSTLIDLLNRSEGSYRLLQKLFFKRLINPFYWVGELIRIPFRLLSFAGFDSAKVERSLIGRIYKFVAGIVTFIWTVVQLLTFFGIDVRKFITK